MTHLDSLLLNECPHTVLECPGQHQATLWAALDYSEAQVAELILALHVVLGGQSGVLRD